MLLACTISLTGEIGQAAINTVTLSDARLNSTVTASCKHVDTYLNYSQQSAGAAWCGHTGIQCTPHKHNDWRRSGRFLSTGGTAAQMQWKLWEASQQTSLFSCHNHCSLTLLSRYQTPGSPLLILTLSNNKLFKEQIFCVNSGRPQSQAQLQSGQMGSSLQQIQLLHICKLLCNPLPLNLWPKSYLLSLMPVLFLLLFSTP